MPTIDTSIAGRDTSVKENVDTLINQEEIDAQTLINTIESALNSESEDSLEDENLDIDSENRSYVDEAEMMAELSKGSDTPNLSAFGIKKEESNSVDNTRSLVMFYFSTDIAYTLLYSDKGHPNYGKLIPSHITPTSLEKHEKAKVNSSYFKKNKGMPIIVPVNLSDNEKYGFLQYEEFMREENFEQKVEKMSEDIVEQILAQDPPLDDKHELKFNILAHGFDSLKHPFITDDNPDSIDVTGKQREIYVDYYPLSQIMKAVSAKLIEHIEEKNIKIRVTIKCCCAAAKKDINPNSIITPITEDIITPINSEGKSMSSRIHNQKETIPFSGNLKEEWSYKLEGYKVPFGEELEGLTPDQQQRKIQYSEFKHIYAQEGAVGAITYELSTLPNLYKVKGGNGPIIVNGEKTYSNIDGKVYKTIGNVGSLSVDDEHSSPGEKTDARIVNYKRQDLSLNTESNRQIKQESAQVMTNILDIVSDEDYPEPLINKVINQVNKKSINKEKSNSIDYIEKDISDDKTIRDIKQSNPLPSNNSSIRS